jgi:hypothetical protein
MSKTKEIDKITYSTSGIKDYVANTILFIILFICLISLFLGIISKVQKLISEGKGKYFFRKNLAIAWASLIFTIFTIGSSIITNYLFLDCPEFDKESDHPWFKKSIGIQIIDTLVSLIIIIISKYWISIIVSHSIDKLNDTSYLQFLNIIYNDEELLKQHGKISHLNIREKSGNVTTAFITLLFQRKLRNKINYLIQKLNLV